MKVLVLNGGSSTLKYQLFEIGTGPAANEDRTIARGTFPDDWPAISAGCAAELAADGLLLLGVDCPSVDARASKVLAVHHALFDGGAYVLENLDLSQVPSGHYDLIALPVKLAGLDAAPVRAILRHP